MSFRLSLFSRAIVSSLCLTLSAVIAVPSALAGDTVPPSITIPRDTTIYAQVPITLRAIAADSGSGVASCFVSIDGVEDGNKLPIIETTPEGNLYGVNHAFADVGVYQVQIRCIDRDGNQAQSSIWTITVIEHPDTTPPTVTASAPTTVASDASASFTANYTDSSNVTACHLFFDGTLFADLFASGTSGSASITRMNIPVGSHTYRFECQDAAGNSGTSATQSITVTQAPQDIDSGPTIGTISPSTVTAGAAATFSVPYSDNVGVTQCQFSPSSGGGGVMQLTTAANGTATRSHTFTTPGSVTVNILCQDGAGNVRITTQAITVTSAPVSDTIAPLVTNLQPGTAIRGSATPLSASYSDASGVTACTVEIDGVFTGSATLNGTTSGTATRSHTFTTVGTHTVKFTCRDAAGNARESSTLDISVSEPTTTPSTFPNVGLISTTSVQVNNSITLSATVSDSGSGLSRCELVINGVTQGNMTLSGSVASRAHTFASAGSYNAYVRCLNNAGNTTNGQSVTITAVSSIPSTPAAPTVPTTPTSPSAPTANPGAGSLIKLACPDYPVAADHPCKAVYYYGSSGRRHAFPNAQVYFTWYNDFSAVREVSASFLASLPLGRNVTYRPGTRMVKFTTLNRVYAVSRGSVLRWVTSEQAAQVLYGANWARQIDDIADLFFTDYTFGTDIVSVNDFNPGNTMSQTTSIDQNQ